MRLTEHQTTWERLSGPKQRALLQLLAEPRPITVGEQYVSRGTWTGLGRAGLADVVLDEDGRDRASLTGVGLDVAAAGAHLLDGHAGSAAAKAGRRQRFLRRNPSFNAARLDELLARIRARAGSR